jgi:hypothetical protein
MRVSATAPCLARALRALALLALLPLAACSTVTVSDYAQEVPRLQPERFFEGPLVAHGVVKDRSGRVIRRFSADIEAYWEDGVGTLEEDFVFDDGDRDRRVWTLEPVAGGEYRATAGDVVGDGVATVAGNSMFLDYVRSRQCDRLRRIRVVPFHGRHAGASPRCPGPACAHTERHHAHATAPGAR